jgi:hypothetical protein
MGSACSITGSLSNTKCLPRYVSLACGAEYLEWRGIGGLNRRRHLLGPYRTVYHVRID